MAVLQKIKKQYSTPMETGTRYYSILSVINNLKLTEREVQLLAFTALRGDISSGGAKQQFQEQVKTSKNTVGNLICELKRKKLLVKEDKKIKVNPKIQMDFTRPIVLQLNISTDGL